MTQPKTEKKAVAYKPSPHTFNEVTEAWLKAQPKPKLAFFHMAGKDVKWDSNFTMTYEVILDGWRYVVQAHVHDYHSTNKRVGGTSFVPGFHDQTVKTPEFVLKHAPGSPQTFDHSWSSDKAYQSTLYKGGYRYPTEL